MYRLRYYLRSIQRPRIRNCGFAMTAGLGFVGVALKPDGRARYQGLQTCGSVWECPSCQMRIKARRAEEIRKVVEAHGHARCALLTLTVRHGAGDDLQALRMALADAWRGFTRGAAWERFRRSHGVVGSVRAVEVTHGANGWHPHIHVLLLFEQKLPDRQLFTVDGRVRWVPSTIGWLIDRWRTMVVRYLGDEHEPDDEHGLTLAPCFAADYLSKLGLELSDPGLKKGRRKGRTPLEIASDYADAMQAVRAGDDRLAPRRRRDAWLWRTYCAAMLGARQLTWSRGLKKAFGIRDRTDLEVSQDEEPGADDQSVVVGKIAAADWATIRRRRVGYAGADHYCLRAAELGGGPGLRKAVQEVVTGAVGSGAPAFSAGHDSDA